VILLVCAYNVPRFFEYDISCYSSSTASASSSWSLEAGDNTTATPLTALEKDCRSALVRSKTYQIVYENALYCLVVYLGPLGLLVWFNVGLVRELLQTRRSRRQSGGVAAMSIGAAVSRIIATRL